MPYRVVCPRCQKLGLVRTERVIAKGEARTHYFCGRCLHEWDERDPLPARTTLHNGRSGKRKAGP